MHRLCSYIPFPGPIEDFRGSNYVAIHCFNRKVDTAPYPGDKLCKWKAKSNVSLGRSRLISPSINRKFSYSDKICKLSIFLSSDPFIQSIPVTVCPLSHNFSTRWLAINPQHPVTNKRDGRFFPVSPMKFWLALVLLME